MNRPRKAILLAAGFGTRMSPLSHCVPKCLMPVWGRPVIDHLLDQLSTWGVREVLVNLHHGADVVFEHLRSRSSKSMRLAFSYEPAILGTGGVLQRASWFLDERPFWMLNADIVMDLNPQPLLRTFSAHRSLATLWLTDRAGPRTVEMKHAKITSLRSKHPREHDTYTFCGLQLLSPEILKYLPGQGFSTIVDGYESCMRSGLPILGACDPRSYWADIGTPESYLTAHEETLAAYRRGGAGRGYVSPEALNATRRLKRKGVVIKGFASASPKAAISASARLHNSVILPGGSCGPSSVAENVIIHAPLPRHRRARRMLVSAEACIDDRLARALQHLGWPAAKTTLECMAPRASQRTFTRLACGTQSVMMVMYDPARKENQRYASLSRFLMRTGWPVPELLGDWPTHDLMLVEDIGNDLLQERFENLSASMIETRYRSIIEDLVQLQTQVTDCARQTRPGLEPAFDPKLYAAERQVFEHYYLQDRLRWQKTRCAGALHELKQASQVLLRDTHVLVHRDFQSSNIILRRGTPAYIDFQGMRFGAASYDLASLLVDPYLRLKPRFRQRMVEYYASLSGRPLEPLCNAYSMAAVQRLTQAIGAYERMSRCAGGARYTKYILPALQTLKSIVRNLDKFRRFSTLVENAIEFELECEPQ